MRKGWFKIPGVQDGDRTLDEQMLGVTEALAQCKGKTVLDLGCAEGLIGREFVRSGAALCHGIDSIADHLLVAERECEYLPMSFQQAALQDWAAERLAAGDIERYDIVLALGVCHKLHDPGVGLRFAARSSADLVLVRMHARSEAKDGLLRSKFAKQNVCNTIEIMTGEGFRRETVLAGPKEETVWWWRRT